MSISLRPTGADNAYRRFDYLRGALISVLLAALLLGGSVFADVRGWNGSLTYFSFAGVLLGLVALGATVIFTVQAIIGSPEPAGFALPPDYVPMKFRDGIRAILVNEWNPQGRESGDTRDYDSYLSIVYVMTSRNHDPEELSSLLYQLEASDDLVPGSDSESRLRAAEQLLALVSGWAPDVQSAQSTAPEN